MIAQHGGVAFQPLREQCLVSIKAAIDYPMDAATKEKKSKQKQFHHARDNAVAALGKVLKYQPGAAEESAQLISSWMSLLPLTHDMEEAQIQNEFLAEQLLKSPQAVVGANYERLEQLVLILGDICTKK